MINFWLGVSIAITILSLASIYRAIAGPTIYDRVISVGVIGTKTVMLLCLIGLLYNRLDMFIDIALAYALLNFVITLAVAKYIHLKKFPDGLPSKHPNIGYGVGGAASIEIPADKADNISDKKLREFSE